MKRGNDLKGEHGNANGSQLLKMKEKRGVLSGEVCSAKCYLWGFLAVHAHGHCGFQSFLNWAWSSLATLETLPKLGMQDPWVEAKAPEEPDGCLSQRILWGSGADLGRGERWREAAGSRQHGAQL